MGNLSSVLPCLPDRQAWQQTTLLFVIHHTQQRIAHRTQRLFADDAHVVFGVVMVVAKKANACLVVNNIDHGDFGELINSTLLPYFNKALKAGLAAGKGRDHTSSYIPLPLNLRLYDG